MLVLRPGNFVPGGWAAVLVSRADMTRCIGLAVLRVVVLAGSAACTAPVGSKLDVPADAAATCAGHCEEIGMRLSAVAIMADNVGCVCEPRSGAVSPSAARETATSAAGMATILMQQQPIGRAKPISSASSRTAKVLAWLMSKAIWAAPERNKGPILDVLRRVLPSTGTLLEIASGSGQHARFFAEHLPGLVVQPSDSDPKNIASIRAWVEEARLPNLRQPLTLDVRARTWEVGLVEALFNANMIHITPWECTEALVAGAGRHLAPGGVFVLYGPFREGSEHTTPSNAAFHAELCALDPRFGVRDLEAVAALAEGAGLPLCERVAMPSNNLCLIFERRGSSTPLKYSLNRASAGDRSGGRASPCRGRTSSS